MEIKIAKNCGFCYGVKRAVNMAEETAEHNDKSFTLGPIIHNPQVVGSLEDKGVYSVNSLDEIDNGTVIIRSHGVGPAIYDEASNKGLNVVDATCPHVTRAQQDAKSVIDSGMSLVILGEKKHPEVISINLWAKNKGIVIETEEEAENIPFVENMGVVVQTTFSQFKFQSIIDILEKKSKNLKVFKTICTATQERQNSAVELAKTVDLMIVVGGKNSGNTTRLAEVCRDVGCPTYHIETSTELQLSWFTHVQTVGVTAGASTPDWIIKEVIDTMSEFEELLAKESDWAEDLKKGSVVEGEVAQVEEDQAWISFGYKTEAILKRNEISYPAPASAKDVLKEGDKIKAVIMNHIKEDNPIYLSMTRLAKDEDWQYVQEAQEKDEAIICKGVDAIPAGLVVTVKSLRGFIPLSQGDVHFVKSLDNLVGTEFEAKVLEIDEKKNRLVLSRRAVLEVARQAKLKEALENINVGDNYKGIVRKIMPYGAFVDIGGIEGLLHISDISWHKIKRVEDVLTVGQEIEVKLQSFDQESNKLSLSLKALTKSPWDEAEENIHVGDVITGKVVRLVAYGAFVAINDDIQGLLHISQITKQRNAKVEDYLNRGQDVEVKVISLNKDEKKLGLALTELMEPVAAAEETEAE
ncbi:bifunctional 4-hydroxy-3-methylbut-2-enyl diphosphate reductase/30S ribosomal protein S1 [uncultured Veillonella sp.]|uniref:bifunctional 4-hydroxy-3-methylbut-2-enyl diphosphate reductase/30S ribosomal protein S1 n=1 Tax=uncultured Veillonella sp. TaxID=159268 RepID=UPI0025D13FFF|nr:bifunctional 4-hydroxy-3-methylbut-2-enyl diphosphate reductase/30S ribosomal protein S1 [uncultured Veillonella sp.]MDY3973787.1 bifunctional 4-hydroxy-3-methylbut-2-enyl diphosphate reductase/30S ribosomal protein S1 [Veillonella caviae]